MVQLPDSGALCHGFLGDRVEQSLLPMWVGHITGARNEGYCVKPLSFGVACFYRILRNPMTVAGIVSKPLGPGILPINVLHTLSKPHFPTLGKDTSIQSHRPRTPPGQAFYFKKYPLPLAHLTRLSCLTATCSGTFWEDNCW